MPVIYTDNINNVITTIYYITLKKNLIHMESVLHFRGVCNIKHFYKLFGPRAFITYIIFLNIPSKAFFNVNFSC